MKKLIIALALVSGSANAESINNVINKIVAESEIEIVEFCDRHEKISHAAFNDENLSVKSKDNCLKVMELIKLTYETKGKIEAKAP